jgi:hypothetical protein
MWNRSRREFLKTAGLLSTSSLFIPRNFAGAEQPVGGQPGEAAVQVLNPRMRVPLSFIIDDSTCLVNMGRYCMPQFATAWPERTDYQKPWKKWPREIPDGFVRQFGEWCQAEGVKGKYSIVPYPACVGWLDRELPGWSHRELQDSLKLVRELMLPNWDIHPEMISHTRAIDTKTGRPLDDTTPAAMENWFPPAGTSVDFLTDYIAFALKILKNCDLPCDGVTTPGGFGGHVKTELSLAVQEAVRDVYGSAVPHYFKYVAGNDESTQPQMEHVRDLDSDDPRVTVSVLAGTGDWFGGWDGDRSPEPDRYANRDATSGRMVELIQRGEPAIMLCHWPGMYTQGTGQGFAAFQQVVRALHARFADETLWMKVSEIAVYWAAKELTKIEHADGLVKLQAPFASPIFTIRIPMAPTKAPQISMDGQEITLREVREARQLGSATWFRDGASVVVCFPLPRGETTIRL